MLVLFLRVFLRSYINMKYDCILLEICIKRLKYNIYIFFVGYLLKKGEVIYIYFNEFLLEY